MAGLADRGQPTFKPGHPVGAGHGNSGTSPVLLNAIIPYPSLQFLKHQCKIGNGFRSVECSRSALICLSYQPPKLYRRPRSNVATGCVWLPQGARAPRRWLSGPPTTYTCTYPKPAIIDTSKSWSAARSARRVLTGFWSTKLFLRFIRAATRVFQCSWRKRRVGLNVWSLVATMGKLHDCLVENLAICYNPNLGNSNNAYV